jgi:hypothetical protein
MDQLTLRGFGRELRERIEQVAREEGVSLNKAALMLLRRGAGLDPVARPPDSVGGSLDEFIGCWTEREEREFLASIEGLQAVDESLWR